MFSKTILLVAVTVACLVQVQSKCDCSESLIKQSEKNGYKYTKGAGLHKLFIRGKTWEEANQFCVENEGGHLAIINSTYEKSILVNLMKQNQLLLSNSGNEQPQTLWVGIYNMQYNTNEWVTVNGDTFPSNSVLWGVNVHSKKRQPENYDGQQNCGSLISSGLDDIDCAFRIGYICELPVEC